MDDAYWPAFTTVRARSTNAQWETVGEGFIKEIDFGRVWLRLDQASDDDKDDIIAEWKGDAKEFLDGTLVCIFMYANRLIADTQLFNRTGRRHSH